MERRARERTATRIATTCRVPASPCRATIHDLSHDGCRVEIGSAIVEPGATIFFELADGSRVGGRVVWANFRTAGIRFEPSLRAAAAIHLGLEQAHEVNAEIVPPEPVELESRKGLLHHWIRRLTGSRT